MTASWPAYSPFKIRSGMKGTYEKVRDGRLHQEGSEDEKTEHIDRQTDKYRR
jgi:hypothetical protein